ncbi:MAG: hypothetical protein AAF611_08595 [Bacteroidota bacterium]
MKKQNIKSLQLNKKSIAGFVSSRIHGGNRYESVRICEVVLSETCSINVDCNTGTGGGGSARPTVNCSDDCNTQLQHTCGCPDPGGTSNLASPC